MKGTDYWEEFQRISRTMSFVRAREIVMGDVESVALSLSSSFGWVRTLG